VTRPLDSAVQAIGDRALVVGPVGSEDLVGLAAEHDVERLLERLPGRLPRVVAGGCQVATTTPAVSSCCQTIRMLPSGEEVPRILGQRTAWPAADQARAQGAHVVVDVREGVQKRVEVAVVQVLREVLVDPAAVNDARGSERLRSLRRHDDLDRSAVVGWTLPLHEPRLLHAVDDPREPALARENPARQLVHADPVVGLFEIDKDVVPTQRHLGLGLQLGVEDVDQRIPALEEDAPNRQLLRRWA
jgi:hypothetical protein